MLPRLPLDDRSFQTILQDARRGIPTRLPEWTDENAHDPGMTFLELFAWLSEMQQYYLSRVPDRNYYKFLDLLGVEKREAVSAVTEASFDGVRERLLLPRGTKLLADDQLFETEASIHLLPLAIERIVVRTEREASDMTASNTGGNTAFFAFGREAQAGSRFYVAFDQEPEVGETVTLSIRLAGDRKAPANVGQVLPSAKISWKAYGFEEASGASWLPLDVVSDDTVHLSFSGRLTFRVTSRMRPVLVHPANDRPRYWICCTLEQSGYELPPRIDRILLNTVQAVQRDTLSEQESYDSPGTPSFSLVADSWLARYGRLRVQVLGDDGRWREWRETVNWDGAGPYDRLYRVERPDADGPQTVRFGDGVRGAIPREGAGTVRIIRHTAEFASVAMIGQSNGLPLQKIRLYDLPCRRMDGLRLQVGAFDENEGELVWEDWEAVADFDRSGPLDRHFVFDTEAGELRFGNDESGAIPAAYDYPNIVLTTCAIGGGERGNIKPDLLTEWVSPVQRALGISVTNTAYASGGEEGESLQECLVRAQAEWQKPYCAVTNEDYRTIATETPGLKVARAHVIPGFAPGKPDSPGAVTVVVVPQGLDETPQPILGFLGTVARHLDERRLLATEVHVIAPEYVRVTVHATVVVEPHFMEEARRIVAELSRVLTPLGRADGSEGWPFGRTVHKGDIFGVISRMNGVAYVQDLWLDAEGRYVRKNAGGDILLPPNGLIYSGEHRIELISRTQV